MDEIDRAQAAGEVYQDAAMRTHRAKRLPSLCPSPTKGRGNKCEDCGHIIPAARMKANPGATRCVPCQTIYEREDKE